MEVMSRITKQSSEHIALHVSDPVMCWKMCEFLSDVKTGQGGCDGCVRTPSRARKGPLNLRGRVKMTLRMQEMWTSTT